MSFNIQQVIEDYGIRSLRVFMTLSTNPKKANLRTQLKVYMFHPTKSNVGIQLERMDVVLGPIYKFDIESFNNAVTQGEVDVYVKSPDGYSPIHVTVKNLQPK